MKPRLLCALAMAATVAAASAFEIIEGRLDGSAIYPATMHEYKISVPDGYDGRPACLYVGLDGILCDAPARIDSLIATGDIPYIIGVYLEPGRVVAPDGTVLRYNRSNEFDATDARFAAFLADELLPEVAKAVTASGVPLRLSDKASDAMIFGLSSGGIAAFTAAWHRPELFSRVFSGCGTFVPMRGGNELQAIVRKSEPRPLRIFLQDGFQDTWNPLFGSWYEANAMLGTALDFAGYDAAYDWAEGGHSVARSNIIWPEVMKWLWRDYPAEPRRGTTGNATLAPLLEGAGEWRKLPADEAADRRKITSEADTESSVPAAGAVYPDGSHRVDPIDGSNYMMQTLIGADGTPYAAQPFYWLHSYDNSCVQPGGMAFDADGNLWVLTRAGLQICDQNGRVRAMLRLPKEVELAGSDVRGSAISIADGCVRLLFPDAVYERRLGVKAAVPGVRPQSQLQG